MLIAFYKIHYNFAALGALFLMWAFILLLRGNVRWFLIITVAVGIYIFGLKHQIEKDPVFYEETVAKLQSFDFVDYIWGGGTVTKQTQASEKRLNQ